MKMTTRNGQAGFTLIELIMVIVILGILSAFALPRFADLGGEARAASIQAAAGSMRSAANIAHAQALAANLGAGAAVSLEGQSVTMVNYYPTADEDGILMAAQVTGSAADPDDGVGDYRLILGTNTVTVQSRGATTAANCQATYTAAAANGAPTVTVVVTDC